MELLQRDENNEIKLEKGVMLQFTIYTGKHPTTTFKLARILRKNDYFLVPSWDEYLAYISSDKTLISETQYSGGLTGVGADERSIIPFDDEKYVFVSFL